MNTPCFHYGFNLGEYSSIQDMPDDIASAFLIQFRFYLLQKDYYKIKYGKNCGGQYLIGLDDIDFEMDYLEFKDINNAKSCEFIQSIINQRHDCIRQFVMQLERDELQNEYEAIQKQKKFDSDYEWALNRIQERKEEAEKKADKKQKKLDLKEAELFVKRHLARKARVQKKKQDKIFKEWAKEAEVKKLTYETRDAERKKNALA